MKIITAILGALALVVFTVIAWLVARGSADKGLMDKMPANAFPARVHFADDLSQATIGDYRRAMGIWNRDLDRDAFTEGETTGLQIFVEAETEVPLSDFHARTTFLPDGRALFIFANERAPTDMGVLRAAHELGHTLGLKHDQLRDSVMYATPSDKVFVITDHDVDVVTERVWPS